MKNASLQDLKDTIFKLTMVKTLPKGTQEQLEKVHLDLKPAIQRCNNVNGLDACEPIWGTMAVPKCPKGYSKMGCCQCVTGCPGSGFINKGFYCKKGEAYNTPVFKSMNNCRVKNTNNEDICVSYGIDSFVERCRAGYKRHGKTTCLKSCPIGWADEGFNCIKPGETKAVIPFPWMPGDNELAKVMVKKIAAKNSKTVIKILKKGEKIGLTVKEADKALEKNEEK